MELKVHDLIRIKSSMDLRSEGPVPGWCHEAVNRTPWVVVRRSSFKGGLIPVGVRGASRSHRFAAHLPFQCLLEVVTPVQLAVQARWRVHAPETDLPTFTVMNEIADYYNRAGVCWGPTGSMGYELASGTRTVTPASDIDLAIYALQPVERKTAAAWHAFNRHRSIRIDALLETPRGACSLSEYVRSDDPILLRTMNGPIMVKCPWTAEA